jgi:hypothetical protein
MFLIPFDKINFHTSLSVHDATAKLAQIVDTESKWPHSPRSKKEFDGSLSKSGFRIVRNIKGRNTYLPWVRGQFKPVVNGTHIIVTFSLHPIGIVAMLTFFLWAAFLSVYYGDFAAIGILTIIFIILHCVLYVIGYVPEKEKAESILRGIFGA